jgi:hypothetical protein
MPVLVEAEANNVYEEGRSVLASLITQLISIVRTIVNYVLGLVGKFMTWAGENPLQALLFTANLVIWVS